MRMYVCMYVCNFFVRRVTDMLPFDFILIRRRVNAVHLYTLSVFLIINQPDAPNYQSYFGRKLYMFRTVPLSIARSFSLYT